MIKKHYLYILIILVLFAVLTACSTSPAQGDSSSNQVVPSPTEPQPEPTSTPTFTPPPTDTPMPTATIVRTPPALPPLYTTSLLNPVDYPHNYIENACEYLKLKWDPNNSTPGTVVMVIMFHSIIKADGEIPANGIGQNAYKTMMETLHEQGFEAITMEQLVNFLETNAKIPERSVLLIADDRHFGQYFDNFFRPYYNQYGWPVVNAWISHPEQTAAGLWDENEALNAEGWVDYQAHGVIHYPIVESTDDAYIMGELQGSIDFFQEHYNKVPVAFIWPGGNFTARSIQLARQVGYQVGFTVNPRGPIMFNWVPLADNADPNRPSYLAEGQMHDPLMVLPRYWPSQVMSEIDNVRVIGKQAAAYAKENKTTELEYYDIVCAPALGPIPTAAP